MIVKTFKYIICLLTFFIVLYLSFIVYFIYDSDDGELVNYANSKSILGEYGGPDFFARLYLMNIKKDLGVSPYNVSYLSMVLAAAESAQDIDEKHYKDILGFASFLINNGQDINDDSHIGMTNLIYSVMTNNYSIAKFLLEHGADPSIKVKDEGKFYGLTALGVATSQNVQKGGYDRIIELLELYE